MSNNKPDDKKEQMSSDIENSVANLNGIASHFTTVAIGTGDVKAAAVAIKASDSVAKTRIAQQRVEIEQQDANSNSLIAQATAAAADNMGATPFRQEKPVAAAIPPEKRALPNVKHGPGELNEAPVKQTSSEFFKKMDEDQNATASDAAKATTEKTS